MFLFYAQLLFLARRHGYSNCDTRYGHTDIVSCVKKNTNGEYDVFTFSGTHKTDNSVEDVIGKVVENCAGELLVTSIDNKGTMSGFDYGLYKKIRGHCSGAFDCFWWCRMLRSYGQAV
ncbi:MAG: hypothetical protein CL471_16300 [Acidobacteria bacterium]|nr:hypothetical protein [Acidobacteriota bacterium]